MLRGGSGRPVSDFEHILLDLPGPDDHGIATLTLNRPEVMNAFTNVMVREMVAAFDITEGDFLTRATFELLPGVTRRRVGSARRPAPTWRGYPTRCTQGA